MHTNSVPCIFADVIWLLSPFSKLLFDCQLYLSSSARVLTCFTYLVRSQTEVGRRDYRDFKWKGMRTGRHTHTLTIGRRWNAAASVRQRASTSSAYHSTKTASCRQVAVVVVILVVVYVAHDKRQFTRLDTRPRLHASRCHKRLTAPYINPMMPSFSACLPVLPLRPTDGTVAAAAAAADASWRHSCISDWWRASMHLLIARRCRQSWHVDFQRLPSHVFVLKQQIRHTCTWWKCFSTSTNIPIGIKYSF